MIRNRRPGDKAFVVHSANDRENPLYDMIEERRFMTEVEKLWEDYRAALRRFIRRRVADESSADDILQDIFLKIHAKIGALKDHRRIRGWFYRVARNAVIDHYRGRRGTEILPEEIAMPLKSDRRALTELSECVRPMIERLPEPYREALILSELEGVTQKEVGKKQGVSLSGAKSRVQRGRAKLKEMMLACCHIEFDRRGGISGYSLKGDRCKKC
jgi:RNA polymerase sigma-70 factor (ECF subfamily)